MQGYAGGKATSQYLAQRVQGASPELLVAMLLEGGQRFLNLAVNAMKARDLPSQARYVNRVADIILALRERLNFEEGGELVENLVRIYDWWTDVLFDASMKAEPERLQMISNQMGSMRASWEELDRRRTISDKPEAPSVSLGDLSV
ncbi:MAG TPA: flagellar export chaperone FliS [Holophaga sp.]|nr:flagellar export chaperone FliS [Holophaga sp.]